MCASECTQLLLTQYCHSPREGCLSFLTNFSLLPKKYDLESSPWTHSWPSSPCHTMSPIQSGQEEVWEPLLASCQRKEGGFVITNQHFPPRLSHPASAAWISSTSNSSPPLQNILTTVALSA